jgi:hypothetical protein
MKKNPKKGIIRGIILIILAITIYSFGVDILNFFGFYNMGYDFEDSSLKFLIPIILIVLGILSIVLGIRGNSDNKKEESVNENISEIDTKNDKFSKAGNHFISAANKFLVAISLQLLIILITNFLIKSFNGKELDALNFMLKLTFFFSLVSLGICISAIMDIKKAGKILKS